MIGQITKDEDRIQADVNATLPAASNTSITVASNGTIFSDSPTGELSIDKLKQAVASLSKALGLRSIGDKIAADMLKIWWMIVCGLILSMLIALAWVYLMRWLAGALVWSAMLGSMVVLTYLSSLAYNK